MKATSWHWHHVCHIVHTRISQITLYFSASQSCNSGENLHSLIFLFFADWSGKWHSPLLQQPIQFKVKWCVLSEISFFTLLLYWAVIYLWPVNLSKFCHCPLTSLMSHWSAYSENSKWHPEVSVCLNYHIPSTGSVQNYSVKRKHSGKLKTQKNNYIFCYLLFVYKGVRPKFKIGFLLTASECHDIWQLLSLVWGIRGQMSSLYMYKRKTFM